MNTPYSEEQKQEFKRQFKSRRARQLLLIVPVILLLFSRFFLRDGRVTELTGISADYLGIALLVVVAGILLFTVKNWRCPACNRYLGRTISPRFCQKCGVELSS